MTVPSAAWQRRARAGAPEHGGGGCPHHASTVLPTSGTIPHGGAELPAATQCRNGQRFREAELCGNGDAKIHRAPSSMLGFCGGLCRHKEETEAYKRAHSADSGELARFTAAINSVSARLLRGVRRVRPRGVVEPAARFVGRANLLQGAGREGNIAQDPKQW